MKIHAIQTGKVAIKTRQMHAVGNGTRRQLNMLLDRQWTDPLPIYAFAIEHPEGVIVVDTGETARSTEPGYFPRWHPYYRFGVRLWVSPEQEIGPQLQRLGIEPGDVRQVVLTHLHTDHAGGLHHFPGVEFLVSREDLAAASGVRGRLRGYPNDHWPDWFAPTVVALASTAYGPFPQSLQLTEAGDVTIVPLHGHTDGQLGVVVEDGGHVVLLGGDSAYSEDLMLRGVLDGPSTDESAARLTHERIRALAAQTPTVYLVAHDPETAERLAERRVVGAGAPASAVTRR
jgi:glyoxylase-like metal-dependent hydrolase (beta-lactamase superfamily II)